jgi:predicted nucleic acid-binding Zn ribbon protein
MCTSANVHAGTYAYHCEYCANQTTINATTTFEDTYYLNPPRDM